LDANLAIIDKRRARPNEVAEMQIIGEVDGRVAVIVDDMVDTAGTLSAAAEAVRGAGAPLVLACATHPVLSGPAIPRLAHSSIDELIVTDTIPLRPEATNLAELRVLSVAPLLGEAIHRTHEEASISSLFIRRTIAYGHGRGHHRAPPGSGQGHGAQAAQGRGHPRRLLRPQARHGVDRGARRGVRAQALAPRGLASHPPRERRRQGRRSARQGG